MEKTFIVVILFLGLLVQSQSESNFLSFSDNSTVLNKKVSSSINYNPLYIGNTIFDLIDVGAIDIKADSSLNLISPNGNEFWQVGKSPNIVWESNNVLSDITIEFSTNNGRSWNTIAKVSSATKSYRWTLPNKVSKKCLVRLTSVGLVENSDDVFEISDDTSIYAIVVIGSSTAEGLGASSIENSWVYKYKNKLFQKNTKFVVFNFGLGGLTTFNLLPTTSTTLLPAGVTIDVNRNITKALLYNPVAIILNLPSNDTYNGYSIQTQLNNFVEIKAEAKRNSVPIWITTTQPRYFSKTEDIQTQRDVRSAILSKYKDNAIDFWTGLSETNGTILPYLDSGDGTHVNDAGHDILLDKILKKNIDGVVSLDSMGIYKKSFFKKVSIKRYSKLIGDKFNVNFNSYNEGVLQVRLYNELGQKIITNEEFYRYNKGSNKFKVRIKHAKSQELYCILTFKSNKKVLYTESYTLFVK